MVGLERMPDYRGFTEYMCMYVYTYIDMHMYCTYGSNGQDECKPYLYDVDAVCIVQLNSIVLDSYSHKVRTQSYMTQ